MKLIDGLKKHFKGELKWWRKYFKERRERWQKFRMQNVKVQRNENIHVHYFEIGVMAGMICFTLIALCFLVWLMKFRMIWGLW